MSTKLDAALRSAICDPECPVQFSPMLMEAKFTLRKQAAEIERLQGLLDDKDYIRTKADYNKGHLSYAGQLEARERRKP